MKESLVIFLVAALAFAGCAGKGTDTSATAASTTGPTPSPTTGPTTSPTSAPPPQAPRTVTLTADARSGTAPLDVTYSLSATNADARTTWKMEFGDGATQDGSALPAAPSHQYTATGTVTAKATVTFGDGTSATQSLSIAVLPPAPVGGPLLDRTYNATIHAPNPVGSYAGVACGLVTQADAVACFENQVAAAQKNGGNTTFFVWYGFTVPAGAVSLSVEGGSHAAQACQDVPQSTCVPDYDLMLYAPNGTATLVGTSADWENAAVGAPAAGSWSVVILYFAGPPDGEATAHIVVR